MTSKGRWLGLGIGVLLIVAAFGLVFWQEQGLATAGVALAQAPTATPVPAQNGTTPSQAPSTQQGGTNYHDLFLTNLAKQLGITVDNLKSAITAAGKTVIQQMVTDGKLTQAQGDQAQQDLQNNPGKGFEFEYGEGHGFGRGRGVPPNGTVPNGTRGFGFGMKGYGLENLSVLEAVAKSLNLAPADLTSQLQGGKTLADIATAQKVDQAAVKQAIIDANKALIQQAVTDGKLTQAQADQILANLTQDKIDLTRIGGGFRRGGFGKPGQTAPSRPSQSSPSSQTY